MESDDDEWNVVGRGMGGSLRQGGCPGFYSGSKLETLGLGTRVSRPRPVSAASVANPTFNHQGG